MKKIAVLLSVVFAVISINAQTWHGINSQSEKPAKVNLISSNINNPQFSVKVEGYNSTTVNTPQGLQLVISLEGATPMLASGCPDLPKVTSSLIIPDNKQMEVQVSYSSYTDIPNVDIAPSKGNLLRNVDPATVAYSYGPAYQQNQFFPGVLAELREPFILRDFRGQTVITYPYQYNPVTKVLRVYHELTASLVPTNQPVVNSLMRTKTMDKVDPEFAHIYNTTFLNFEAQKYTILAEGSKMLIICYANFMSSMQNFVNWKNDEGIKTEMVSVATAGNTSAAIKTYVTNYYNTNGLTYLLLVGDAAQCPTFTVSGGGSDNSYGYISGSDHYQEIFVGRISAENTTQVLTQVNRTISYEKSPSVATGKYNQCVGIGSDQGPGDDSEYDYQHIRNILNDLTGYTYASRAELFDGSQGGSDAAGDLTAASVTTQVNNGAGVITYCGHGGDDSFVTTGFSNSNMTSLTNTSIWPFIWSVACVNGNFTSGTCFAEAWLRATYNNQPSGAVATLMSTINQSWNPPMEGQDEMVDILVESYTSNIKRTFGGISVNGLFKMNETYQDYAMTDTWTIFGDPSLMVRTNNPTSLTVTHNPTSTVGATSFAIQCSTAGAVACITINHQIIGRATVVSGAANITFPALTTTDTLLLTVTAYNKVPYQAKIPVTTATSINADSRMALAGISVFPNPVTNQSMTVGVPAGTTVQSIKLYNRLGENVWTNENLIPENEMYYHIGLPKLAAGVYFLSVNSEQGTGNVKVVITE